jgi:hypothetical protein
MDRRSMPNRWGLVAAKEETPATRGYVLAGARSLCVVEQATS